MTRTARVVGCVAAAVAGGARAEPPAAVRSPDGRVGIELSLRRAGDADGVPHYRVTFGGAEVVGPSRLGVELAGGAALGGACKVEGVSTREVRDEYTQFPGKRRRVTAQAAEAVVRLREAAPPGRRWEVVLRAYDDGAAFRYRFPAQEGWDALAIARERTEFRLPAAAKVVALPLNGFATSHEARYQTRPAGDLPPNWLVGLPLLAECPGGTWAAVTEANVTEYAGLYLAPAGGGVLAARLSPLPTEPGVAVRAGLPHASPWRVVMAGDRVGRLVESDLVLNLTDPCAIPDTSWIKPGKTTFPWWNGFHEENPPFPSGLNTATAKHYIDFCAEAGVPYHSLDGIENTAWYGGPTARYEGADPTVGIAGLDLPAVLAHAKAKGVRIRLWMHWGAAAAHMGRVFPLYREWGVEGVMLDFMDRDDQEMNRWVRKAVKLAADNRLTVTLHGCPQPTGLERTYPNLLTHEGVLNLEYGKWDPKGVPPEHDLTVPFTRMLAGPLDFHQGSFRGVQPEAFKARDKAPLVMGTPARMLATYVVFQNHLPMVADYPSAYRGHPALPAMARVPTTWDDTRVLDAKVGELAVVARRSGADWWVGAMGGRKPRDLAIPLGFLPAGRYRAEVVADHAAGKGGVAVRTEAVAGGGALRVGLGPTGGCLVHLTPAP